MNLDLSREALLRASSRAAELYTEVYADLEQRAVSPAASREQMATLFADGIGEEGIGLDAALEEFAENVLPNCMGTPHPMYFGLVNSSPLPAGPLADLLVSALNNNGGSFHQSPAISAMENMVVAEFARLCGLEQNVSGMIVPGGTLANLHGLMLARQLHFPEWQEEGPTALKGRPLVYASDQAHFCNDRATRAIGIGKQGFVSIPSVGRGEIDVDALDERVQKDRQAGHLPFAVVANGGTTGTGAIDDLDAVAGVCQQHGLWMHVDACYGGGALLLDPPLANFAGIARADSIAIDPHKWFFIPMTAGLFLTKHDALALETFDIAAPYIPNDGSIDAFRLGFPTSRRSSGLTVWMTLRAHGWRTIRESVARNITLIRLLESLLQEAGFRVLEAGQLSVACVRFEPAGMSKEQTDALQKRITKSIVDSGRSWFSNVTHGGVMWMRMNLVNIHTREHHVRDLVDLITKATKESV
ncbi:MAG: aspartate aminotransferase family protein [Rubripirellula sp.]